MYLYFPKTTKAGPKKKKKRDAKDAKKDVKSFIQYSCGFDQLSGSGTSEGIFFPSASHLVVDVTFWDKVILTISHWSCSFTGYKTQEK